jgi:hypothetical protein
MPKKRKPGWKYFYSELLKEEFAEHEESGYIVFEKGAIYSPEEIKIIVESGSFDLATHKVKTVIKGEIVNNEQGKQVESSDTADNSHNSGKISENSGVSKNDENGDYFIY